jgi:DNA-binding MltR family transcriptional regulator
MKEQVNLDSFKSMEKSIKLRFELMKESDRGCVLMATSFLDYELEKMFEDYLIGSKKVLNEMLSGQGSLATFSSRIRFAFSLGLISKKTMDDLNVIRKIRNECGHNYESISLEAKITKQRIYSLKTSIYSGDRKIKPRKIFINNVYMLLGEIQGRKLELTKVKELTKSYSDLISLEENKSQINEIIKKAKKIHGENISNEQLIKFLEEVHFETINIMKNKIEDKKDTNI